MVCFMYRVLLCMCTLTFGNGLDFYSINVLVSHLYFDFFLLGRVRSESCNLARINLVGANEDLCNFNLCAYASGEKCEEIDNPEPKLSIPDFVSQPWKESIFSSSML